MSFGQKLWLFLHAIVSHEARGFVAPIDYDGNIEDIVTRLSDELGVLDKS